MIICTTFLNIGEIKCGHAIHNVGQLPVNEIKTKTSIEIKTKRSYYLLFHFKDVFQKSRFKILPSPTRQ